MGRARRVAILASSEIAFGRRIIRGVGDFVRANAPWELYFNPFDPLRLPSPSRIVLDGVIAHPRTPELVEELGHWTGPLVRIGGSWPQHYRSTSSVSANEMQASLLVVEDFLGRGFRRFAFAGEEMTAASVWRQRTFAELLRQRGFSCASHIGCAATMLRQHWNDEIESIAQWLRALEPPVAVLATNDERAFLVVEACRRLPRQIPEEIAVIGMDNSVELCETCNPSLSSVDLNTEAIGYEAAALMARLFEGDLTPRYSAVPPRGLVHRQSTDALAIEDPELRQAIRFIRGHLDTPLSVCDVLNHVPLSRRALEQRFQSQLGRSPRQEIQRLQLQRVRQFLRETDWSIKRIARACGFPSGEQLARAFHHVLGLTPSQYRKEIASESRFPRA